MNETLQRKVPPTDASRLPANSNRFAGMRLSCRRRGQSGSIIVEMAMCMPVMILLVFVPMTAKNKFGQHSFTTALS